MNKRYLYWSQDGIKWTNWFNTKYCDEKWQLKNKLKNEYSEADVTSKR